MEHIAFISYRHHSLDSAIAQAVQRQIEQYRIPPALQTKLGVKNLHSRVFRDKTELPITDDINTDILQALEHSQFLIVICSTHTAESQWVDREIREFLRTHSHSRILTVLAEGEPEDVIPPILRCKPDGTPIEPLSCDFRGYARNRRAVLREELPRLMARLLGCSYDDLRQRQREYRMKRLTAVFGAALAAMTVLAGYFLWSSTQIRQNYNNALRNQSLYLSTASLDALSIGDRATALQLALAALPETGGDRPWVPQAEYALSQATGSYAAPDSLCLTPMQVIDSGVDIYRFFFGGQGSRLYVLDDGGLLTAWDLQNAAVLFTLQTAETRAGPSTAAQGYLYCDDAVLIPKSSTLCGYDAVTGELLWSREDLFPYDLTPCHDSRYFYLPSGTGHLKLDSRTGQTVSQITFPDRSYSWLRAISQDDRHLAFAYEVTHPDQGNDLFALIYDTQTEKQVSIPIETTQASMCFTEGNDLVLCQGKNGFTVRCLRFLEQPGALHMFTDYRQLWEQSLPPVESANDICVTTMQIPTGSGSWEALFCRSADAYSSTTDFYFLLDADTGDIHRQYTGLNPLHAVTAADGCVQGVSSQGELTAWSLFGLEVSRKTVSCDLPGQVVHSETAVTAQGERLYAVLTYANPAQLVLCTGSRSNPAFQSLEYQNLSNFDEAQTLPQGILLESPQGLCLLDGQTLAHKITYPTAADLGDGVWKTADGTDLPHRQVWEEKDGQPLRLDFIGATQDGAYLLFHLTNGHNFAVWQKSSAFYGRDTVILRMDTLTGRTLAFSLPLYVRSWRNILPLSGEALAVHTESGVEILTLEGEVLRSIPLPGQENAHFSQSPDGKWLLLGDTLIDPDTGETIRLTLREDICRPEDLYLPDPVWNPDSAAIFFRREHLLCAYSTDGQLLARLNLTTQSPEGCYLTPENKLLLACSDGYLYQFQLDGTALGRTALSAPSHFASTSRWVKTQEHLVFLNGHTATLFHADTLVRCAQIDHCIAYLPQLDTFLLESNTDGCLGYIPRQALQDLQTRARKLLGSHQLTEAQLQEYGLLSQASP